MNTSKGKEDRGVVELVALEWMQRGPCQDVERAFEGDGCESQESGRDAAKRERKVF